MLKEVSCIMHRNKYNPDQAKKFGVTIPDGYEAVTEEATTEE